MDREFFSKWCESICVNPFKGVRPGTKWSDFGRPIDNIIYGAIAQFRNGSTTSQVVPKIFLQTILPATVRSGGFDESYTIMAISRLDDLYNPTTLVLKEVISREVLVWLRASRHVKLKNLPSLDPDQFVKGLSDVESSVFSKADEHVSKQMNENWSDSGPPTARLRSGLRSLDNQMGGGFPMGQATLVIAPQGGGKTVLASQLAGAFAYNFGPGLFISTEQGEVDIYPRIYSNMCNIPFNRISENYDKSLLSDAERAAVSELERKAGPNLQFRWWNSRAKSISLNLRNEVIACKKKCGACKWMIFDWLGAGLGELSKDDFAIIRHLYLNAADTVAEVCRLENLAGVAFAQPSTAQSKNKKKIDATHLAECKDLGRKMSNILGISSLEDPRAQGDGETPAYLDQQYTYLSKCRKGVCTVAPFMRDFAYQRFK